MKRLVLMLLIATPAFPNQVFVTNPYDSGAGSLRQAILDANNLSKCPKPCQIIFNITGPPPASGFWTIEPLSPLPQFWTDQISIDGATQTAFSGDTNPDGPEVVISGAMAGVSNGLVFNSLGSGIYLGASVTALGFVNWSDRALTFVGLPWRGMPGS